MSLFLLKFKLKKNCYEVYQDSRPPTSLDLFEILHANVFSVKQKKCLVTSMSKIIVIKTNARRK